MDKTPFDIRVQRYRYHKDKISKENDVKKLNDLVGDIVSDKNIPTGYKATLIRDVAKKQRLLEKMTKTY